MATLAIRQVTRASRTSLFQHKFFSSGGKLPKMNFEDAFDLSSQLTEEV